MPRLSTVVAGICLGGMLSPLAARQAQQPAPPTFRSGVTLVTVDVIVLDREGKPVPGLTAEDFQVKLNGKLQPVRALSYVQVARQAAPMAVREIPPEEPAGRRVVTNATPAGEARLFVLVADDLSFSAGSGKSLFTAAARFIDRQPAGDYIGFTSTSGTSIVNPTRDRAPVRKALSRVVGEFMDPRRPLTPDSPTVGIGEAVDIADHNDAGALRNAIARECFPTGANALLGARIETVISQNPCAGATQSMARMIAAQTRGTTGRQMAALIDAINAMKPAPGLKQLVVMSDGIGVTRDAISTFSPVSRAAAEAGVQLSLLVEEGNDLDMSDAGHAADESGQHPDTGLAMRRREDRRMFRSAMQTLADVSGGSFHAVVGEADQAFERVSVAGSALYRIGVEPPGDAPAGKAFAVATSVNRPGLTVQANRQAVVPGPAPVVPVEDRVKAAINEGQPFFNVPIRMAVAMRRAASGQVELGIGLDVPSSVAGPLTMAFGLVSEKGELHSGKRALEAPADGSNFGLTFSLPVAPGKYQLRFAVSDATGSVGSVDMPIDARLLTMGALTVSDVLTWWTNSSGRPQFLALDEVPPGVTALGAGIELYPQPGTSFPENVRVRMALIPAGREAPVLEREVTPLSGADMMRAEALLPLANVPAGSYILRATVLIDGKPIGVNTAVVKRK